MERESRNYLIILMVALAMNTGFAQKPNERIYSASEVDELYSMLNYKEALKGYLKLLAKDPKNETFNMHAAICYLNTNIGKAKAVPHLEIITRLDKFNPDAWFLLGRAYHYAYQFDDAINAFNKFKETGKGNSQYKKDTDRYVQYCLNAKELVKYPMDVTFENLGKEINSPFADYYPFIPADESFLVFSTRRSQGALKDVDGLYTASVFISRASGGKFGKAKTIGPPINTGEGDEEIVGLSNSGSIMVLAYANMLAFADLFIAEMDKSKSFKKAVQLSKNVNSNDREISAAINDDGDVLVFTSDRKGGQGGTDFYMSRKLPNGEWGLAVSVDELNTPYDEDFPNLSKDGKTLYFSSQGHSGMGGFDVFKAEWDEENRKWVTIKNVGYPINTPDDDMSFRMTESGRYAYVAALRDGGVGDLDIYRVIFNTSETLYSLVQGTVSSSASDSLSRLNYGSVFITVRNKNTNEIYGNYLPNRNSGKYILILTPGDYIIQVEAPGYQSYRDEIKIKELVAIQEDMEKNIVLIPAGLAPEPKTAEKIKQ